MRFASSKLHKNVEPRPQQQRRTTLMQPQHCDLQASCKRAKNYVRNSNGEHRWCSHSTAICKQQVAKEQRNTCATGLQEGRATLMQPLQYDLQAPGCRNQKKNGPKPAPKPEPGAKTRKNNMLMPCKNRFRRRMTGAKKRKKIGKNSWPQPCHLNFN